MKRVYERIVVSDAPPTSGDMWIDTSGNVPILKIGAGFEWKSPISPSDGSGSDDDTDYGKYFTIEATQDGTKVYFRQSSYAVDDGLDPLMVEVSTDDGDIWTEVTASPANGNVPGAILAELDKGEKVLIRGRNEAYGYYSSENDDVVENCNFYADKPCYVYGNIMTLVEGDGFERVLEVNENAFAWFFSDCDCALNWSWVLSKEGEELLLPATKLANSCYYSMFSNCTGLVTAPKLPATMMANNCYGYMFSTCTGLIAAPVISATTLAPDCCNGMFYECTSLVQAPELPATIMANSCYKEMFYHCASLATAPELPGMTLAKDCYYHMFESCTSLATAPELPATTLADWCYEGMFSHCSNLSYIKAMFTTTPENSYTQSWVYGVKATGTFVKNSAATWDVTGINGVPTGWTVETASE